MRSSVFAIIIAALLLSACGQLNSYCGDGICSVGEMCEQDCDGGTATLSWTDKSRTEDGFEIERQDGNDAFSLLTVIGSDETRYIDAPLELGTRYAYRVRGYRDDPASTSAYSNIATVQTRSNDGTAALREITIMVRIAKDDPTSENINIVIQLAQERQERILHELEVNPLALHTQLIPSDVRRDMPAEALELIEQPVQLTGAIEMTSFDDFEQQRSWNEYAITVKEDGDRERYDLYATPDQQPAPGEGQVTGYVLGTAVIAESIEYERTPVVADATGEQRTLHMLIKSVDAQGTLPTMEQVKDRIDKGPFALFINETSYGKTWFTNDVTDWIAVEGNAREFHSSLALDLHKEGTVDLSKYDRIVYHIWGASGGFSCVDKCPIQDEENFFNLSQSLVGLYSIDQITSSYEQSSYFDFVLAHELGHALGVIHANSIECTGTTAENEECRHSEYGNAFDVMGTGGYSWHINSAMKEALGWFDENAVQYVTTTGTYTIKPLEQEMGVRSLRIPVPGSQGMSIEYRRPIGFDSNLQRQDLVLNTRGAMINYIQEGTFMATRIIDASKTTSGDVRALQIGESYADPGNGVIIGPVISATADELTLNITRMEPQCVRKKPLIGTDYNIYIVERGQKQIWVANSLQSMDSPSCNSRTADVSLEEMSRGAKVIEAEPTSSILLEPGKASYISMIFNVSESAPYGLSFINMTVTTDTSVFSKETYSIDIVNPLESTLVESKGAVMPGAKEVEIAVFDVKSNARYPAGTQNTYVPGYPINNVMVSIWPLSSFDSVKLRIEKGGQTSDYIISNEQYDPWIEMKGTWLNEGEKARISIIADVSPSTDRSQQATFTMRLCSHMHYGCYPISGAELSGQVMFNEEPELPAPTDLVVELG